MKVVRGWDSSWLCWTSGKCCCYYCHYYCCCILLPSTSLAYLQLLLHRRLRDSIPSQTFLYKPHPEWIAAVRRREEILHKRNAKLIKRYNRHTHNLCPLQTGDTVTIQNPLNHRWNTTGKIISVLPERQYKIRVDGSRRITLRNRRFLKKCKLKPAPTPIPSATVGPTIPSTNATVMRPPLPPCNSTYTATRPQQQTTHITPRLRSSRIPRALSRLLPHNKPGVKERQTSHVTRPTRGGEGRCRRQQYTTAIIVTIITATLTRGPAYSRQASWTGQGWHLWTNISN